MIQAVHQHNMLLIRITDKLLFSSEMRGGSFPNYDLLLYFATNLPKLTAATGLPAWLGVLLADVGLAMLYRCSSKDPGFIRLNSCDTQIMKDDEPLLKIEMNNPALLAGNWSQLCATCKIVRPLGAEHCSTCDRCVEQFDHHYLSLGF